MQDAGTTRQEEMVEVWVPKKHLMAVYGYVAALERGEEDEMPVSSPQVDSKSSGPGENEEWSPRLLRRMYDESPPAMVLILDHLADNPDREVPSAELVGALKPRNPEANSNTLAGTLGAFGRRVGNRYGAENWPFKAYYSHGHFSLVYWMDGWVAQKLRDYRTA